MFAFLRHCCTIVSLSFRIFVYTNRIHSLHSDSRCLAAGVTYLRIYSIIGKWFCGWAKAHILCGWQRFFSLHFGVNVDLNRWLIESMNLWIDSICVIFSLLEMFSAEKHNDQFVFCMMSKIHALCSCVLSMTSLELIIYHLVWWVALFILSTARWYHHDSG